MIMSKETLIKSIREVPDFPIPGILFYDVTTLFKDPGSLPGLRIGMKPAFRRVARIGPIIKPLDYIPTTLVIPLSLYLSNMILDNSCKHHGSLNRVVTS
jgi:hypothetical protein